MERAGHGERGRGRRRAPRDPAVSLSLLPLGDARWLSASFALDRMRSGAPGAVTRLARCPLLALTPARSRAARLRRDCWRDVVADQRQFPLNVRMMLPGREQVNARSEMQPHAEGVVLPFRKEGCSHSEYAYDGVGILLVADVVGRVGRDTADIPSNVPLGLPDNETVETQHDQPGGSGPTDLVGGVLDPCFERARAAQAFRGQAKESVSGAYADVRLRSITPSTPPSRKRE